jgi:ABC-type Zn uptake system ZnuABC Zn-binding protein ZnuA
MRMILSCITLVLVVGCAAVLAACGAGSDTSGAVRVVATTTQLGDFARTVAGQRADVVQVLPANADPHEYEPKPSDAEALVDADLILKSGGDLDQWFDQVVESSGSDAPELTLIDHVTTRTGDGGETDPHWWQDPANAIAAVTAIRDQLIAVDPGGRRTYDRNAAAYIAELRGLDAGIARCVDRVPPSERLLVTSHDALGYYADRYGIRVIGAVIPALSTQAQSSAGETSQLIDLIQSTGVKTIFPESGISPKLEQQIADQAGAQVGGTLWADSLGPEGSSGSTYISAEESNTNQLVSGFTGAPVECRFETNG